MKTIGILDGLQWITYAVWWPIAWWISRVLSKLIRRCYNQEELEKWTIDKNKVGTRVFHLECMEVLPEFRPEKAYTWIDVMGRVEIDECWHCHLPFPKPIMDAILLSK